jgi:hypothetical protein
MSLSAFLDLLLTLVKLASSVFLLRLFTAFSLLLSIATMYR